MRVGIPTFGTDNGRSGSGGALRHPLLNVAWHQLALPRWCRKRRYDVLFLPAGNRRLPLGAPCPSVGTVHDFSSLHVEAKYDPARMFYITRVLPFLIRRLTRVIAVSQSTKRDLVEYAGVPEERIAVIPQGVDHGHYFPRDTQAASRAAAGRGIRPPYLLFVSRLEHPGKNHVRLIRAFAHLKEAARLPHQLVLAGSPWTGAEEILRAARSCAAAADIVFTGFLPARELPELYSGAELCVYPSLYEGFGLPVLEAMACGVPVACSNCSSLPEVAGDAAALFDPGDEEAIAAAVEKLLADPALRAAHARRGLARSRAFGWPETAARTLEVLRAAGEEGR